MDATQRDTPPVKAITLAMLAAVLVLVGCSTPQAASSGPESHESLMHTVTYLVDGTAESVDLTMQLNGGTSQQEASLPLKNKSGTDGIIQQLPVGSFIYVSAQNQDDYGTVTCHLVVDGVEIQAVTSTSDYGIATCKGRV